MEKILKQGDLIFRFLAKLIDLLIVLALTNLFAQAGIYIGIFYLLISDGFFKGRSIGKKLLRLKVINLQRNTHADFRDSILRNFILALSLFLILIPFIGWIILFIIFAFEFILMIGNPEGKRLGDLISKTMVVEE